MSHWLNEDYDVSSWENAKEYAKFQELGVDYCQGYYVSSVEKAGLTSISPSSANDGCIKNLALG